TWFAQQQGAEFLPGYVGLAYEKVGELRYGENPHQRGALYRDAAGPGPLGGARLLQGKEMSFNNWLDVHAASELAAALPDRAGVGGPRVRVDGLVAREVERDRVRARRCHGRDRGRADVEGRQRMDRGAQGGGPGGRRLDGLRRLLPLPRRDRGRGRRRRRG